MMKIPFFALFLTIFSATYAANCKFEGYDPLDYYWSWQIKPPINDTHEGEVITYQAVNIVGLLEQSSVYLSATLENDELKISTNERFRKFEEEYDYDSYDSSKAKITLTFKCSDGKELEKEMYVAVQDTNNHDPILSQEVYEYHFGMPIPKNYDLNNFFRIQAKELDFSNDRLRFEVDFNENVRLEYNIYKEYYSNDYKPEFSTLKQLKGPFNQEYSLTVTDTGKPQRKSTGKIVINVVDLEEDSKEIESNAVHPPIFAKHLYYADYFVSGNLEVEEKITIRYGAQKTTTVTQSNYKEYFRVKLNEMDCTVLDVQVLSPLPKDITENYKIIVIEIEAVNPGLTIPSRTALVVRMPRVAGGKASKRITTNENEENQCTVTYLLGIPYNNSVFPLIIYTLTLLAIIFVNTTVIVWYYKNRKAH